MAGIKEDANAEIDNQLNATGLTFKSSYGYMATKVYEKDYDKNILPYTVLPTDVFLLCDQTADTKLRIILPKPNVAKGREIHILDSGLNAATNNIECIYILTNYTNTVPAVSSTSIYKLFDIALDAQYTKIHSDGTSWWHSPKYAVTYQPTT